MRKMANKYCNLDGSKKIKDEYQKINIGFDKVEEDINKINDDINALDERVDTIITTPVEDVSAEEIIDARGGRPVLGKRFEDIEDDLASHKAEDVTQAHGFIYEEGTWTPRLNEKTTYTEQVGTYVRVGNMVHLNCILSESPLNKDGLGTAQISLRGLPFVSKETASASIGRSRGISLPSGKTMLNGYVNANTNYIVFRFDGDGANDESFPTSKNFNDNGFDIKVSVTFRI